MYFMLGTIQLEAIDVTEFSETHSAEFAEHAVLKGKPRLQAMGEKLNELSFAIRLHHKIGGVESRYQALLKAKAKQEALALIWGAAKHKGNFVITDISSSTQFTDAKGNVLCREMNISLKEFVGNQTEGLLGAALNQAGSSLLGSILPTGVGKTLSDVKETVKKGVELYQTGKRAYAEVKEVITLVKTMIDDPQLALAYLPSALSNLSEAVLPFGEITGMQEIFTTASGVLSELSDFSREATNVYDDLTTIQTGIKQALNGDKTGWENWLNLTDNIDNAMDNLAPAVAKVTTWVVLREDEEVVQ